MIYTLKKYKEFDINVDWLLHFRTTLFILLLPKGCVFVLYFYQLIDFRDRVINLHIISAVEIDLQRRYSHIYHIKHLKIFEWNHFQSALGIYNTQLCLLKSLYLRSSSKQMISGKASYRQISWNREIGCHTDPIALQFDRILGNVKPRCLSHFRAFWKVYIRIPRLQDFARSCGKTSYRLVNRGPE